MAAAAASAIEKKNDSNVQPNWISKLIYESYALSNTHLLLRRAWFFTRTDAHTLSLQRGCWHVSNKENEQLDPNEAKIWLSYERVKSKWKTAAAAATTNETSSCTHQTQTVYIHKSSSRRKKIIRRSRRKNNEDEEKIRVDTKYTTHIFTVNRWTAQIICIQKKLRTKLTTMCGERKRDKEGEKKHEIMSDRDNRSHSERNKHKQTHWQELCGVQVRLRNK